MTTKISKHKVFRRPGETVGFLEPEAFIECLYRLRTRWRHREKSVFAGGVHYPTLVTAHHTWPPVSTSGARLCWLDQLGSSVPAFGTHSQLLSGTKYFPFFWVAAPLKMVFPKKGSLFSRVSEQLSIWGGLKGKGRPPVFGVPYCGRAKPCTTSDTLE